MLDIQYVRENPVLVQANCVNRQVKVDVAAALGADDHRRAIAHRTQLVQERQNELSRLIPREKEPAARQTLVTEGKSLREEAGKLEAELREAEAAVRLALGVLPNLTHPDAPVGADPESNLEIRRWGEPRVFDFPIKDHVTLMESNDLVDFEAGAMVTGQKFYFLKNEAVLLELALVQFAMMRLVARGYTPVITPDLARVEVLEGIGFQPRDPDPDTRQVYTIAQTDLCLVATAEITLGGMHKDQVLDNARLPLKYVGLSHCFRTEAGAPGRDTRGLYRVHQFTKVEMFAFCTPEQSEALHLEMLAIEEEIFQALELPYRVIDTCTGDLGGPAYRKYDLEAWMPGRGGYGEVTSTSNCTDFQARRLNIRSKSAGQKGTRFVHTLNGTAISCARALVALVENHQQADGSITVPTVLRPWVGKDIIRRGA